MMTKSIIRDRMKERRNNLSNTEIILYSKSIQDQLFSLELYKKNSCIFSFVSFGSEVNTHEIIRKAWEEQKKVYAPRVEGRNMDFYRIEDFDHFIKSKFGVLEPVKEEEKRFQGLKTETELLLLLLPGLAFDHSGNRIGYGAGYYDRYLNEHGKDLFYKIAIAYDFQVMDQVEAEEHDVKADMILTPTRMIFCRK